MTEAPMTEPQGCTCGAPTVCEWHEFSIPRGTYGPIISVKNDYNMAAPDSIDGPLMRPKADMFKVGQRVIVQRIGDLYCLPDWYDRYKAIHPHFGMSGVIVDERGPRCYGVRFDSGDVVGFYANELKDEETP